MKEIMIRGLIALMVLGLLAGCARLHDEDYYWCRDVECPEPMVEKEPKPVPEPEPVAPPPPPEPEPTIDLSDLLVDILFPFDSARIDLPPEVSEKLDELIRILETSDIEVESMVITGHTDRIGDPAYNEILSRERAESVRDYLREQGLDVPMEIRAMGERDPVTTDCDDDMPRDELIECLQPDRRVTLDLIEVEETTN